MSRSVLFVTFVGGSRDPSRTLFFAVRTSSRDISRSVLGSRFAAVFVFVCGPRDSSRAVVSFATGRGVCNLVVCLATNRGQCFFCMDQQSRRFCSREQVAVLVFQEHKVLVSAIMEQLKVVNTGIERLDQLMFMDRCPLVFVDFLPSLVPVHFRVELLVFFASDFRDDMTTSMVKLALAEANVRTMP